MHPHITGGVDFKNVGQDLLTDVQFTAIERCLQGICGEWLMPNPAYFQQPPKVLTPVFVFEEGKDGCVNLSFTFLCGFAGLGSDCSIAHHE